jgi:predicted kinase
MELHDGHGVIVDATFKQPEHRRVFLELGNRLGVPVLFLECWTPMAEVERRLRERERRGDSVSDATWDLAQREAQSFPPFDDVPERQRFILNTDEPVEDRLLELEEQLSQ